MPSGKVHLGLWRKYSNLALIASVGLSVPVLTITGGALDKALVVSISSYAGYLIGGMIGPDLDQITLNDAEAKWVRSVIFLPLIVWSTLYARIMQVFGGHRSMMSHMPYLSTFIRLCWFTSPFVILAHYMGWLGPDYSLYFMGLWFGMGMADTVHAVADFVPGFGKQKRGRKSNYRGSIFRATGNNRRKLEDLP